MDRKSTTARFVPAQATETNIYEGDRRAKDTRQVMATWTENLGGGIGAAAVVTAAWIIVHGLLYRIGWQSAAWPDSLLIVIGAGVAALLVFGWLMFMRSAIDEIVATGEWNKAMQDMAALEAENERLADMLQVRTEELRQMRAEQIIANQQAARNRQLTYTPPAAQNNKEIGDARTLLERATRKMDWSRDGMKTLGWTQPQWEQARDTLIAAKLLAYNGKWPKLVQIDYELACAALDQYRLRASNASLVVTQQHDTGVRNDNNDISG